MDEVILSRNHDGASVDSFLRKFRPYRRFMVVARICQVFFGVLFTRKGLLSKDGRQQFRGKARRTAISFFPSYARKLQKKHGLTGGCTSCGASCNLMFKCPHWDTQTHLCGVYEDRPEVCRLFPITPMDISDRTIVRQDVPCGFTFQKPV